MTPAQRKWIGRAKPDGRIVYAGPRGYGRSAWERCMESAAKQGLVTPTPWGEYEVTEAGRAAMVAEEQTEKAK